MLVTIIHQIGTILLSFILRYRFVLPLFFSPFDNYFDFRCKAKGLECKTKRTIVDRRPLLVERLTQLVVFSVAGGANGVAVPLPGRSTRDDPTR